MEIKDIAKCSNCNALLAIMQEDKKEIKRLREGIETAIHALRSYQYGNSDEGLAKVVADKLEEK